MTLTLPPVGIVVVHYGDPALTVGCLASIEADPSRVERRVVVVDNLGNLEPGLLGEGVLLVRRQDNPGFGSAANQGLAALDPDRVCSAWLVLNNDTALRPGFLDAVVRAVEDGVGAAGEAASVASGLVVGDHVVGYGAPAP